MVFPINFYNQFLFNAAKICKERADRKLPAEFIASELAASKNSPKRFFGCCLLLTE